MNYKGFERFSVKFHKKMSVLVGPNNAGKSTLIGALRLSAQLLAFARRRTPNATFVDETRQRNVRGFLLGEVATGFVDENIAHEFRNVEARLELFFKNASAIVVVWPADGDPYFYVENGPGTQPQKLDVAKDVLATMGVVQTLSPIEHRETILSEKHVRENIGSRLASKHFRNQLYILQRSQDGGYENFIDYLLQNTPEIRSIELSSSYVAEPELDLFFDELKSKTSKELYWAGDGLQIWFQLLFHIWRNSEVDILVLDEPEVYLHPDLQRRLVNVIDEVSCQVILATHAPEILAESDRESIVYVDRNRRSAKRMNSDNAMSDLNDALGSGFNLRLAKALRSRVALFVEGNDMKLLSNIARRLGAMNFANERGLTVVPLGGSSNRKLASSFGLLNSTLLESSVDISVFLDRDFLDIESVKRIYEEYREHNVAVHVWERNEIESYLLVEVTLARLSGLPVAQIASFLDAAVEDLRVDTFGQILSRELRKYKALGENEATTYRRCQVEFDTQWGVREWRLSVSPAKEIFSKLNQEIAASGGRVVSPRKVSAQIWKSEVPSELSTEILRVEQKLMLGTA